MKYDVDVQCDVQSAGYPTSQHPKVNTQVCTPAPVLPHIPQIQYPYPDYVKFLSLKVFKLGWRDVAQVRCVCGVLQCE